jgi:hypothetical protein
MISWTNFSIVNKILNFDFRRKHKEPHLTGLDAALYNIDYITTYYPAPYTLYLSGGVDSQAMLYAWAKSGIPFNTFSGVYNFESNLYDLESGSIFAKMLGIKISYYNFDLINFLETEHRDFALKYKTGSPQFTTFIKMASLTTEGTVIFSGECAPPRYFKNPKSPPVVVPGANDMGLYYYGIIENKPIIPWFFIETETIAYSWEFTLSHSNKEDDTVEKNYKVNDYKEKVKIYHQNGYPVVPQDKKQNGFEKIKEYYDNNSPTQPTIKDKFAAGYYHSNRNFDLLYRNKYEDKIKSYKYNIIW